MLDWRAGKRDGAARLNDVAAPVLLPLKLVPAPDPDLVYQASTGASRYIATDRAIPIQAEDLAGA